MEEDVTQGALRVETESGIVECPLKHTDVKADISGFIARVTVTQTFQNPYDESIEAVYVFPLPHKAAVDDMTMVIGERRIVGVIKRRAAAREIYERALAQGLTAALLEQERPNIFTQSVGNIGPKQEVNIEISYVDVLEYDMGTYEFHFPMVVGPRYIPGKPASAIPPVPTELQGKVGELDRSKVEDVPGKPTGTGWSPDTDRVPDASRITPPVLKPGYRNGHDISLSVKLDAGVPIQDLRVANHETEIKREGETAATAVLSEADSIPNKDFVLRYDVVGDKPEMAVLCHTAGEGPGYFMLMIQPREDERLRKSPPREISFLIDVSGSMSGRPTAKVKEVMRSMLNLCKKQDTLQVITFAGSARKLFKRAVPANEGNIQRALNFTEGIRGGGGTEMLKGIKMAINDPLDKKRVRIVIMLTDGYIGNEAEIIAEVGRRCGDQIRFWCLGIGSSPNRFLVDGVARQGGGMSKVLALGDDSAALAQEIMFRIHRAQLAGISVDWGNIQVSGTYPAKIPELWAGRPVILFGRYHGGGETTVTVNGKIEGEPASWPLPVSFPGTVPENGVLAKVWARNKIEDLMQSTYYAGSPVVEEAVTEIALEYRLMSQYTSFVAVDESRAGEIEEPARPPRRMLVPVPIPEGTRYEGFFGDMDDMAENEEHIAMNAPALAPASGYAALRFSEVQAVKSPVIMKGIYGARQPGARGAFKRRMGLMGKPGRSGARYRGKRSFAAGNMVVGGALASANFSWNGRDVVADKKVAYDQGYTMHALAQLGEKTGGIAKELVEQATELKEQNKLAEARAILAWAYLLDAAAGGPDSAAILESLEEVDGDLVKKWAKRLPGLDKKLDLVIRRKSVPDALAEIGKAAGIPVRLMSGSIDDACAVTGRKQLEVTYLDLRRATVAQALDWILRPARMNWWLDNGGAVAGTVSRGRVAGAWIYDVSLIALPDSKEIESAGDYHKRIEAARKEAERFLATVRVALELGEREITWFGPGRLLVYGDVKVHARAGEIFEKLADPKAEVAKFLGNLHKVTSKRAAARKDDHAAMLERIQRGRIKTQLNVNAWKLLATAAAGSVDIEALSELESAWSKSETGEILGSDTPLAAVRAAWAISESAKAVPGNRALDALARTARKATRARSADLLASLGKATSDHGAFLAAVYSVLALRDDAELVQQAIPVFRSVKPAGHARIAAALVLPKEKVDPADLVQLVTEQAGEIRGADVVALAAIACRRAGGEPWRLLRAESKEILGGQPLPGSVVILVGRLEGKGLPTAREQ